MKEFITNLPKAELHLHIEGTLSPQTILKLAGRNNIDFPHKSVEAIKGALAQRPPGLAGFLDHHYLVVSLVQTDYSLSCFFVFNVQIREWPKKFENVFN